LVAAGKAADLPAPSGRDVVAKLQHRLALITTAARRKQLFSRASYTSLARLHSYSGQGASAWLTAIPSTPALRLNNTCFSVAIAYLLGLPLPIAMPRFCVCGKVADSLGCHFAVCKSLGGDSPPRSCGGPAGAAGVCGRRRGAG
jgi:hypothetical protein